MERNPSERSKEMYKTLTKFGQYIGMYSSNKSLMNIQMFFALLTLPFWLIMVINGMYKAWGNSVLMCHSLLPISFLFVYLGRVYNKFFDRLEERSAMLQEKTEHFYEKWETSEKYKPIMFKRIEESAFYTRILVVATLLFYHLPALSVDYDNITTGSRLFNMYAFVPFLDSESDFGFILNSAILHSSATIGAFTLIILDSMFVFYGYQIVPMCDIFCLHLEEFAEDLKALTEPKRKTCLNLDASLESTSTSSKINDTFREIESDKFQKAQLRTLIVEYQQYDEFIKEIIALVFVPCFASVIFNSLSIALSIVVLFNVAVK